jgi:hypothetical protein
MLRDLSDRLRVLAAGALASTTGDQYRPVKLLREVLGTANDLAGRPFCSREELERRRTRRARAAAPMAPTTGAPPRAATKKEPAPVMIYFDGQDHRSLGRLQELLRARDIPFQVLDVTDDEANRSWAATAAQRLGKRGEGEFPLLFIAGEPVGGLPEVTQLDVNGGLHRRVYG